MVNCFNHSFFSLLLFQNASGILNHLHFIILKEETTIHWGNGEFYSISNPCFYRHKTIMRIELNGRKEIFILLNYVTYPKCLQENFKFSEYQRTSCEETHRQKAHFQDKDILCDRYPPDWAYAL